MANTTVSKVTISKDNANALVNRVIDGLRVVNKGYLSIAGDVCRLYDTKAFEVLGYENFDAMCRDLFDMSHGTTVGIRKVFSLYGSKSSKTGEYTIPDKYTEFGYTKLLLFATDKEKFAKANINPIEEFDPKMTIGEIKSTLKGLLDDKAKEQDANAIDTDGSIIDNEAEAPQTEAEAPQTEAEAEAPQTEAEAKEATPLERMANLISEAKALKEMSEMNNWLKPEKLALFDAIIANAKDLQKLLKKS